MVKLGELLRTRLIEPITSAQGTPESIARGGALGMWVALTPTVGIQMPLVLVLSVPLAANVPVGLAMCWITNPVTLVFFYFAFYWLGALMLGRSPEGFGAVAGNLREAFGDGGSMADALAVLGGELMWPMLVGSVVVASACAFPTYHLLLWIFRRRVTSQEEASAGPSVQADAAPPPSPPGAP